MLLRGATAPVALVVSCDQCRGCQGFPSLRDGSSIALSEISPPQSMKLGGIGIGVSSLGTFSPKLASSCKSFGQEGGRFLGVALERVGAQGEKLGAAVLEAFRFWRRGWNPGLGGGSGDGSGSGGGGDGGSSGDSNVEPVVEFLGYREEDDESQGYWDGEERLSSLANLDASRDYFCSELKVVNVEGMVSYATLLLQSHSPCCESFQG